jgi:hypothetical protein
MGSLRCWSLAVTDEQHRVGLRLPVVTKHDNLSESRAIADESVAKAANDEDRDVKREK